jgi:hypothetical protein
MTVAVAVRASSCTTSAAFPVAAIVVGLACEFSEMEKA